MVEKNKIFEKSLIDNIDINPNSYSLEELKGLWNECFSSSFLSGKFILWLINTENYKNKDLLLIYLLNTSVDPGAFVTLSKALISGRINASEFNENFVCTLINIINDNEKFYGVRGYALLFCVLISIDNKFALRKIRSFFFSIDLYDDGRFLRYIAASIGILSSHIQMDEAIEHIELLTKIPEASEEACLQLGYLHLANGLSGDNRVKALASFKSAQQEFSKSALLGEGRIESKLLAQCLEILNQFHSCDSNKIKNAYKSIDNMAFEYSALLVDHSTSEELIGCRADVAYNWITFSNKLLSLEVSFDEEIWLDAAKVIEEQLFFIFSAQKSIFKRTSNNGISTIVRPIISDKLQRYRFQQESVRKWLLRFNDNEKDNSWNCLYDVVKNNLKSSIYRELSNNTEDLPLRNQYFSKATNQKNNIFDESWVKRKINESNQIFNEQLSNPAVTVLREKICNHFLTLDNNSDLISHKDAETLFFILVDKIIPFIILRINSPVDKLLEIKYLYANYDGKVVEAHLQDDFYNFIHSSMNVPDINYEPSKHSAGRSDIKVSFKNVNTVIEFKKIDYKMSDNEIIESFSPQAFSYQTSNSNFCFLGILDNFDSKGEQINLRDCFSCHVKEPLVGETKYTVILFRIQAQRKTPSELSKRSIKNRTLN